MDEENPLKPVETKSTHHSQTPIVSPAEKEYGKLAAVVVGIYLISVITFLFLGDKGPFAELNQVQSFAVQFMGVFFFVFGSFKLVNLKSFVHGFQMYDLLARRSYAYAVVYPFLQIAIGVAMFVIPGLAITHFLAMTLSGIALLGVIHSVSNKKKLHSACLGNVAKMPLTTISGIEDGSMFAVSLLMFIVTVVN